MQIQTDPNVTYANGSGRLATIGDHIVHLGMEVEVYGRSYWVVQARPNGVGFKLYVVDAQGNQYNFKTREVNVPETQQAPPAITIDTVIDDEDRTDTEQDAARRHQSLLSNIAFQYPTLHLASSIDPALLEQVYECLDHARRLPSVARLPWAQTPDACFVTAILLIHNGVSPEQRKRFMSELRDHEHLANMTMDEAFAQAEHYSNPELARLIMTALWSNPAEVRERRALRRSEVGGRKHGELTVIAARSSGGQSKAAERPAPTKKSGGKDIGDPVAVRFREATDRTLLAAVLVEIQYADVDAARALVAQYDHLSFGLAKMNVVNKVRRAYQSETHTIQL